MRFVNGTPFESLFTVSYGKDGRERVVVATRATYELPLHQSQMDGELPFAATQFPLIEADQFEGEPGLSAPLKETDFAHFKPRCDVLFSGYVYGGNQSETLVGIRVGTWSKTFRVTGSRTWQKGVISGAKAGPPERFDRVALSYASAYGGVDFQPDRPDKVATFRANPVGKGYHPLRSDVDGLPMPNTERINEPITSTTGSYIPMSLGPVGRNWTPRSALAGTYDQRWTEVRAPYLPDDFDYGYFQAAAKDQQISYPNGGEEIVLLNLTSTRQLRCRLPLLDVPVLFAAHGGQMIQQRSVVDTILFEPELGVLSLTARAIYETRRSAFDLEEVIVGHLWRSPAYRQRIERGGKTYYRDLDELIRARSRRRAGAR